MVMTKMASGSSNQSQDQEHAQLGMGADAPAKSTTVKDRTQSGDKVKSTGQLQAMLTQMGHTKG